MSTADTATKHTTTVFISYAREDSGFAYRLEAALIAQGFAVLIDKTGIAPGEDWRKRIEAMIRAADVVVFVLSPASVGSTVCTWEVERTENLKKRLLPLKWRSVDGLALPLGLSRPNWLDFSEVERVGPDAREAFDAPFTMVVEAINTDISWVREHTEFIARAERWKDAGRPADHFLLAGIEISNAQQWVGRRPEKERIPEDFHEFLKASLAKEERNREELNAREREISQRTQLLIATLARRAREAQHYTSAMRLALAGEPSDEERGRGITPEPTRRAELAAAAHAALNVACLASHSGEVRDAAFNTDGSRIVTASADGTARVWDSASGRELTPLRHRRGAVDSACFSPDGRRIATASGDCTARLWDAATGAQIHRFRHESAVHSAQFNFDGSRVVSTSNDNAARLWDTSTGVELGRLSHDELVLSAMFSPNGRTVVTASEDDTARLWDVATGSELDQVWHGDRTRSAHFSLDGRQVLICSDLGLLQWDFQHHRILDGLREIGRVVAISRDGSRIVTVQDEAAIERKQSSWPGGWVNIIPSKEDVTLGLSNATIWDVTSGVELFCFRHDGPIRSASFSSDGRCVVTASSDCTARVWHAATGEELARYAHGLEVNGARFSADGSRVLTFSRELAWNWEAGRSAEFARLQHGDEIRQIRLRSSGSVVGTIPKRGPERMWDALSGDELVGSDGGEIVDRPTDHASPELAHLRQDKRVLDVQYTSDGSLAATASRDGTARVWDAANGAEIARLDHGDHVISVQFDTLGSRLLTRSGDAARVWDTRSRVELARFHHPVYVASADFCKDDAVVVTSADYNEYVSDEEARLWDVTWVARLQGDSLCRGVTRARLVGEGWLTDQELQALGPLLGHGIDRDVVSRWLEPSPDSAEIGAAVALWRRHREMALALARRDWAKRADMTRTAIASPQPAPGQDERASPTSLEQVDAPSDMGTPTPNGSDLGNTKSGMPPAEVAPTRPDAETHAAHSRRGPDDLKRIRSIGVLTEKRLNEIGITTYEDIANWTREDIVRVSRSLDFKDRIERERWVEQARILDSFSPTTEETEIPGTISLPGEDARLEVAPAEMSDAMSGRPEWTRADQPYIAGAGSSTRAQSAAAFSSALAEESPRQVKTAEVPVRDDQPEPTAPSDTSLRHIWLVLVAMTAALVLAAALAAGLLP